MKPASESRVRDDIHWWNVEWEVKFPSGSGILVDTVVPAMAQSRRDRGRGSSWPVHEGSLSGRRMRRSTKRLRRGDVTTIVVVGSEASSGSQRMNFLIEIVPIVVDVMYELKVNE